MTRPETAEKGTDMRTPETDLQTRQTDRDGTRYALGHGPAGQIVVDAILPGGNSLSFSGSCYGTPGPVVLIIGQLQTFVDDPGRFGEDFGIGWVRNFLTAARP